MDKEQARFILHSFRPDGADVNDHDFAEALALATENRELGEWLAGERAFDAAFARALASVELPVHLRDDILGCLAGERGDFPQAVDARDSAFIGAIASIQPPATLRDRIITAMDRTASGGPVVAVEKVATPVWRRFALPLAAAAGVALAFLLTRGPDTAAPVVWSQQPHIDVVQAGFIRTYESPLFSLDETQDDHQVLVKHLRSRKLPCPGCLPPGLTKVKSIGCRELIIDGKRGSLICFDESVTGVVHLVIFRREDVSGALPEREHPDFAQVGNWAAARWEDDRNVFILIGATDLEKLATLF
jgi:hypothetical protein